jgi:hypothetical protein
MRSDTLFMFLNIDSLLRLMKRHVLDDAKHREPSDTAQ